MFKLLSQSKRFYLLLGIGALLIFIPVVIVLLNQPEPLPVENGQPIPLSSSSPLFAGGFSAMPENIARKPISLSEGRAQPQSYQPLPIAQGEPLTAEEIENLLARLPGLPVISGDRQEFNWAGDLIPPPRTGDTVAEPFPPTEAAPPAAPPPSGPLEVLRYSPEGEIPIAPFISITFNHPMAPLGTLAQLDELDVPVQIDPSIPGKWRWLGTRTLTFQAESNEVDRLPKATTFRVTIPAGTRSAVDSELAEETSWTFSTPPPEVVASYPDGSVQPLEPLFFLAFDQRISPDTVLAGVRVESGTRAFGLRMASNEEIGSHTEVSRLLESAEPGRWLAFKTLESLPPDSDITVTVPAGTPSSEGPLVTQTPQTFHFRTYAALRITEHQCGWSMNCHPLEPFHIHFNNPIDPMTYDESYITVHPDLPGARVDIYGATLAIQGASRGRTAYTVQVSGALQDIFGQSLGEDASLEFRVGPAIPSLFGPNQHLVTLDPSAQPVFSVYSINYSSLDVKVYSVDPSDWPAYKQYLREQQRREMAVPGVLVIDKKIPVDASADSLTEVRIDLDEVLNGEYGHFIIVVQPPADSLDPDNFYQKVQVWVQVTQIGLDAFADQIQMTAWATSLADGAPLSDVIIQAGSQEANTGPDGLAQFPLPASTTYIVASLGLDRALLPHSSYYWQDEGWNTRPPSDELRWYVFDDRQMYRPGEEVHIKGWLRRIGAGPAGDVGLVGQGLANVRYRIFESRGNEIGSGQASVNSLGGFDLSFIIPKQVNLGQAYLLFEADGSLPGLSERTKEHYFQIQEFRRPEFEVTVQQETPGPYFAGEGTVVSVKAAYYAGGPLPNAEVNWTVMSSPAQYSPPNWPDFIFGTWRPWWWFPEPFLSTGNWSGDTTFENFSGHTDANGAHYLRLDFPQPADHTPVSVRAEGTVMDVNRQAWTGSTNLLVHPAELYVGLRSKQIFVDVGKPLEVDVIVADLDGNPISGRQVEVTAVRLDWQIRGGDWQEIEADPQSCSLVSSEEPGSCTFETSVGGSYRITARVSDDRGRLNQSQLTRWVSGGERPPSRNVEKEEVNLIPDQESYQPGETARILVLAPFSPAEGLLTVSRSGLLYTERFRIEESTYTLEIPVVDAYIPNLHVQVDLTGAAPRRDDRGEVVPGVPDRPAYASGYLKVSIPPVARSLSMELTPAQRELEPGGETSLAVNLRDSAGRPVQGAELVVVVVDEAVLALSNYNLLDPLNVFYSDRPSQITSHYGRESIVLVDPLSLTGPTLTVVEESVGAKDMRMAAEGEMAPMEAPAPAAGQAAEPDPIRLREDFNPLAVFSPSVTTDSEGNATIAVKLPDNLTRYRVMVVAVEGGRQFGMAESNLTARLPLMVRPSAPRFLNFGDIFEFPIVLQNQTGESMQVDVAMRVENLRLTGPAGVRVTVPAYDRVEVRFPAQAQMVGTARFQAAAISGSFADAAYGELPVYTPATSEAFAVYGVIDQGAILQPLAAPENIFPQYGGLEINTSSTALQALTDAVIYLVTYPFDSSEQLASRILAISALRDVLEAFQSDELPPAGVLEAAIRDDIDILVGMQNSDGGYPYWRRAAKSIPFNSIHAAYALHVASQGGYAVPADTQARLLNYLSSIENYYEEWYHQEVRWTLSAYALYVRHLVGDSDPGKAQRLINEAGLDDLPMEATGWLWHVLRSAPAYAADVDSIRRHVSNRVVETAGAANFTTHYTDQSYLLLSSDRRTDAILLEALMLDNPQHDLIPKLVNGLLAHRSKGRWETTQENVFVLLALNRYFNTYESQTPEFTARIWLGEDYAGGHEFSGRTTERHETLIPMSFLVGEGTDGEDRDLILSKEGSGRLYYRLGLRYAPDDLALEPLDMGFVVQRVYEAVDDPGDVSQDEDGTWRIKAGAQVRVRLTMVADNRRYHVALVDPLPAGLEITNPDLAVSGSPPPTDPSLPTPVGGWRWWWWGPWYEHQNLRDERAEAFASLLWDGVHEYTYLARATTPGTFVVPPAKAEEMYSPEVFGRSGSDRVVVE
jgi:alpha-2-macroglobulin